MKRHAVIALGQRLQDDPAFAQYLDDVERSYHDWMNKSADAAADAVSNNEMREMKGGLKAVRAIKRELLGEKK